MEVPGCGCDTGFFPGNALDGGPALGSPALYNLLQDKNPGDNARLAHYREDILDKFKFRKIVAQPVLRNVGWIPRTVTLVFRMPVYFYIGGQPVKLSELLRHQKHREIPFPFCSHFVRFEAL